MLLLVLPLMCFSQSNFDVIFCKEVKLFKIDTKSYISPCSMDKETLIKKFGTPDSETFKQISWDFNRCVYGLDSFEIPINSSFPTSFRLNSDKFIFIIKDSLEIQVGLSINKILKDFPKSAENLYLVEPNIFLLTLMYGNEKDGKTCFTDTSIQIIFNSSDNKIVQIRESTIN